MKRVLRSKVFETNSSSCHTISIEKDGEMQPGNSIPVNKQDDKVHIEFGEFGWEERVYTDPYTKLQYLLTMVLMTEEENIKSIEDYYETEGFKMINKVIKEVCNCDGIEIENHDIHIETYDDDSWMDHNGYIDHQSCEDYANLKEFLDDHNIDVERFIFDSSVELITDNDNH